MGQIQWDRSREEGKDFARVRDPQMEGPDLGNKLPASRRVQLEPTGCTAGRPPLLKVSQPELKGSLKNLPLALVGAKYPLKKKKGLR